VVGLVTGCAADGASAVTVTVGEGSLSSTTFQTFCNNNGCKTAGAQLGLPPADGNAAVPADGTIVAWRARGQLTNGGTPGPYVCLRVFRALPGGTYGSTGSAGCAPGLLPDLSGGLNNLSASTPGRTPIRVQAGDRIGFELNASFGGGAQIDYAPRGSGSPYALFFGQAWTSSATPNETGQDRAYMINADVQLDRPTVTSVAPGSGPVAGGTVVTIAGRHLANASRVAFGGVPGSILSNTNTEIRARAPAHAAGAVDVTATTVGGTTAATPGDRFVYAVPDRTAPLLSNFKLSPKSFVAANTGPSVVAAAAVGTKVSYSLSEPAKTKFTVQRRKRGVKKHGHCVAGKPRRGRKSCTRWVAVKGGFKIPSGAGAHSFRFMGRLKGKALKRGRYRLTAVATDAHGNKAKPKRRAFRVIG
jgi:hypothetical protein